MDLFLYQPGWSERRDAAWLFVNPFSGISSYGGLIGGTLGFFVFAFWSRVKRLRYADAALAPGKVGNDAAPALERDPGVPPRDTAIVDLAGAVAAPRLERARCQRHGTRLRSAARADQHDAGNLPVIARVT